ncbi:MAG TPA: alpha/beta hydrolase domain-containing protein [Solirubrobacteraceae bacterium]|nr:alpha/beta hydrolase domain-containing protein [Solirubrobacteraceae bacterium]
MIDSVTAVPHDTTADIYSPCALPDTPAAAELEAAGYVQEEYFVSGAGDVYGSGEAVPKVIRGGVEFVTRLLIARPRDPAGFCGRVHLSGIHPFLDGVQWNWAAPLVLGSGSAYVAVGTGTDAHSRGLSTFEAPVAGPAVTRWFDSRRYAPLSWPEEDGIRWTVFSDVAAMLRRPDRPILGDLQVSHVYASGWSFLGSFLRTYINEGFHELLRRPDGGPLFDGYAIGISSPWQRPGYLPINSATSTRRIDDPRRRLRPIDVPVIEFLSQNEGALNGGPQAADIDEGLGRHRLYEVAGTSHEDLGVEVPRTNLLQLAERRHPLAQAEAGPAGAYAVSDVPLRLMFSATMENLHRWVTEGEPPPASRRLELDKAQEVARDELGNPLGGVRSVQLDLPLARYGRPPNRELADETEHYLPMYRIPLAPEEIARRYPAGREQYLERASAAVERMVRERWILPRDAPGYALRIEAAADAAFSAL